MPGRKSSPFSPNPVEASGAFYILKQVAAIYLRKWAGGGVYEVCNF